jgi:hypothetical protein
MTSSVQDMAVVIPVHNDACRRTGWWRRLPWRPKEQTPCSGRWKSTTDTIRVLTSGRTRSRVPQGFGAYLKRLSLEAALAPEG